MIEPSLGVTRSMPAHLDVVGASQRVAAFFDMDNTVLRSSSGRLYLKYLRDRGYLPWSRWIAILGQISLYVAGLLDFPHLMARLMTQVADAEEAETLRISEAWFRDVLRSYITDGARVRIEWHRRQGHHVALVSASTPYAVVPVARDLGLADAYLATHLEVTSGRFTGRVQEPACYGSGKLTLTQAYAIEQQLSLEQSYFYSDSHHDLPLLEAVGHPVAVNPNRKLSQIATARKWPVVYFY
jgi:putative phosphoserine phosphatase/1-acylglycerol-3-phosphate O-acyltransferase